MRRKLGRGPTALFVVCGVLLSTVNPPWLTAVQAMPVSSPEPSRVELLNYRTPFSKRFRNPDGSLTEEVYTTSIHSLDEIPGSAATASWPPLTINPWLGPPQEPFAGQSTLIGTSCPTCNYADRYALSVGNDTMVGRGKTRSLLAFYLPPLPSGAIVSAAALSLTEYSGKSSVRRH